MVTVKIRKTCVQSSCPLVVSYMSGLIINVQGVTLIQKETNFSNLRGAISYFYQQIVKEFSYSVACNHSDSQNYLLGNATMEWKDMVILSWAFR